MDNTELRRRCIDRLLKSRHLSKSQIAVLKGFRAARNWIVHGTQQKNTRAQQALQSSEELRKLYKEARATFNELLKEVPVQLDHARGFHEQVLELLERVGLSATEWQTTPLLVNLPSLSVIAATLRAELHGRMGYFPPVIRLRPVEGAVPPRFEVAEILNLQHIRDTARAQRAVR